MTGFTEQQIADLAAPLSRSHVREREQSGRKVSYIEGWTVIAEANRIFGFDAWDRETIECRCVAERETKIGQQQADGWRVGYIAKVRITVRAMRGDLVLPAGAHPIPPTLIVREGTGYGSGIDRDLGAAHESATKEAETDAAKRALMTFGNPFGLALYDKTQSEVEPVQRGAGTPVGARPAIAPPSHAGNGTPPPTATSERRTPAADDMKKHQAGEARNRIRTALEKAETPKLIDEIISINSSDLQLIKNIGPQAYENLMTLANRRKSEMFGATG